MPYILARAFVDGKLGLDTFSLAAAQDPRIQNFGAKIRMELDPTLPDNDDVSRPCEVIVTLKDGKTRSESVGLEQATRRESLSTPELKEKFTDCATRVISREAAGAVANSIDHLEELESLDPLMKRLMAG